MEVLKMLALSTSHLTSDTADDINYDNIDGLIRYRKDEYGWFVYVPEENWEFHDHPADIYDCLVFARKNGFDWIMFDRDVEPIDELPVYEW